MMLAMHTVQAEVGQLSVALTQRLACAVLSAGQPEHLVQCALAALLCPLHTYTQQGGLSALCIGTVCTLARDQVGDCKLLCFSPVCCFKYTYTHTHTHSFSLFSTFLLTLHHVFWAVSLKQLCNMYL